MEEGKQKTYRCCKGCCLLKVSLYDSRNNYSINKTTSLKAGIIITDPRKKKILLVQSRNRCWSIPKGTAHISESPIQCAIREVWEETGLRINPIIVDEKKVITIHNRVYFHIEIDECPINIPNITGNDSHGSTWLHFDCLQEMIRNNHINVNSDCKKIIYTYLNPTIDNNTTDSSVTPATKESVLTSDSD